MEKECLDAEISKFDIKEIALLLNNPDFGSKSKLSIIASELFNEPIERIHAFKQLEVYTSMASRLANHILKNE